MISGAPGAEEEAFLALRRAHCLGAAATRAVGPDNRDEREQGELYAPAPTSGTLIRWPRAQGRGAHVTLSHATPLPNAHCLGPKDADDPFELTFFCGFFVESDVM